jgi:flagellar hook-basal body complex protein FliE
MNPIHSSPITNIPQPPAPPALPQQAETNQPSFKNLLLEGIEQVNSMQQQADRAVEQLVTGGDVDAASVLTSIQKADMSFRMMMQIRNKLMQAYQEVKDMRI